jgi:hypothetical protein
MITHVVMMKFKDRSPEVLNKVRDSLVALPAQIPEIKYFDVGVNIIESSRAYDVVLVSRFDSLETLDIYSKHPAHVEALQYIHSVLETAASVDYES